MLPPIIGRRFLRSNTRCSYRLKPRATMAGAAPKNRKSPMPVPPRIPPAPFLYAARATPASIPRANPRKHTDPAVKAPQVIIAGQNARNLAGRDLPNCRAARLDAPIKSESKLLLAKSPRAKQRRRAKMAIAPSAPLSTGDVRGTTGEIERVSVPMPREAAASLEPGVAGGLS